MAIYLFSANRNMDIIIISAKAAKSPFLRFKVINPEPYLVISNRLLINFASAYIGAIFLFSVNC